MEGERDNRGGGVVSIGCLDYFAMAQSTPSDLYFQPDGGGEVGGRGQVAVQFRANETIPPRSFVTTGCDCRPIKVDSLQMDWKADAKPHSPVDGTCAAYTHRGGATSPDCFAEF